MTEAVIEWLLEGDPAIRWQVMRDLLDEPPEVWEAERRRVTEEGWVAEMLTRRTANGWPRGRWTDAPWSLLVLMACGLPEDDAGARSDAERQLARLEGLDLLKRMDLCHVGFWLGLGAYFLGEDPRLGRLAEAILSVQYADGGWNCQMRNYPDRLHSSFNTTFNVLEGLRIAGVDYQDAEARALEFILAHRLYRSDKTGEVISERFTDLTYPWHWHYTVLRGLDYMRLTPAIADERAADALELLRAQRKPNGRWPLQRRIPGTLLVEMEKPGGASRWNTLRVLRVLRAAPPG
jgi:hypothetical protein